MLPVISLHAFFFSFALRLSGWAFAENKNLVTLAKNPVTLLKIPVILHKNQVIPHKNPVILHNKQ